MKYTYHVCVERVNDLGKPSGQRMHMWIYRDKPANTLDNCRSLESDVLDHYNRFSDYHHQIREGSGDTLVILSCSFLHGNKRG